MEYLYYIGIGICMLATSGNALGEAWLCGKAIDGMSRNPEMYAKLRTAMILGCSLVETTAIYCLLMSILMLFVH